MKQESGSKRRLAKELIEGRNYLVWTIANRTDFIVINQGSQYQIINVNDMGFWFQDLQEIREERDRSVVKQFMTLPSGARITIVGDHFFDGQDPIGYRAMLEQCEDLYKGSERA
jgi:hypothetical protein